MNLVTIAWKSIRQRALASSLTALSVALGVTLMVTVLVMHGVIFKTFNQPATGYDLIVGAKGSSLQLVLNTIFHLGKPVENIPYLYYKDLKANPRIEAAIPLALGDTTQQGGFRIMGTIPEFFGVEYMPGKKYGVYKGGRYISKPFDAVIGASVARENNWDIGSTFKPVHGVDDGLGDAHVHDEEFTVVGVLGRTGTPNDKGVFVHLDGFYMIEGHEKPADEAAAKAAALAKMKGEAAPAATGHDESEHGDDGHGDDAHDDHGHGDDAHSDEPHDAHAGHHHHNHGPIPDEQKEVTAVLIRTKSPIVTPQLQGFINDQPEAQAVSPIQQISMLFSTFIDNVQLMLLVLITMIILVSGVGIFVSIYNSMSDRKREIAIMRALGARRGSVFAIILAESILLCVGGGILGVLLGHGLVFAAAPYVEAKSGIVMNPWAFEWFELILIPALVVLASLVGMVPGMTAYRTDVAKALSN
ncbi:Macrolide export ATP-binding/permease protein MacB [Symmachiella dynata]|uniref:ABC transporter permease n=1 Tax=Symmachiella dynata TaxID=2527995 RepID=UPI0011899EB9|nr:ABC transporter permease [Symmachiella dynata]QDT51079.1 Macrolide export ATP-binding/permease protein MacB [Symmachiella dynata]